MDCTKNSLQVVYGDVNLGVHGEGFDYIFSYGHGGPVSLVLEGKEWLYKAPRPTFWRATTDNDKGNGFSMKSGMWLGADMFIKCAKITLTVDGVEKNAFFAPDNNAFADENGANEVVISYIYETTTIPSTTVEVTYSVDLAGKIKVDVAYAGKEGLPELPVFGMRFIMPTKATKYCYQGLSGETYPDRMAGGIPGVYEVEGLPVTPYMVPQDCGVHMDTEWVEIYRDTVLDNRRQEVKETGIKIAFSDKKFAFACLPYTAEEMENAYHHEDLPLKRRTVLSVLGAVRGIGGIDSWGAPVNKDCTISAEEDIKFSFVISKA